MDTMNAAPVISRNSQQSEYQVRSDERRRAARKLKDGLAIADLRQRIPDIDNIFDIYGRIGSGTFSTVLLASLRCEKQLAKEKRRLFAIKHLIPTSHPSRVEKELRCLIDIGGKENVVGIELCLRRQESVAFVMPYIQHDRFHDYFDKLEPREVQSYLHNLLVALKRVHSFQIIHRDVKPSNFLYNRKSNQFMLVDFGLAQNVRRPVVLTTTDNNKRKVSSSSDSPILGNDTKRLRNNENMAVAMSPAAPPSITLVAGRVGSTTTTPRTPTTVGSPFKMPLKQINEIITPKSSMNTLRHGFKPHEPLLTRQVKSAVLGASMTSKLLLSKNSKTVLSSPRVVQPSDGTASSLSQTTGKYNTNRNASASETAKCFCYGKNQVCNICLIKREIPASRAGTPGYRPPEVLLKYTDQTTAVDIWAVGVILISILSGVYQFFKAPDDFLALAEIVTLFGDETIRRTALALNRQVCISHKCKPLDLRKLCIRLRNRQSKGRSSSATTRNGDVVGNVHEECSNCQQKAFDCLCADSKYKTEATAADWFVSDKFPPSVYDLLGELLKVNPHKRITAAEALQHPFFSEQFA